MKKVTMSSGEDIDKMSLRFVLGVDLKKYHL